VSRRGRHRGEGHGPESAADPPGATPGEGAPPEETPREARAHDAAPHDIVPRVAAERAAAAHDAAEHPGPPAPAGDPASPPVGPSGIRPRPAPHAAGAPPEVAGTAGSAREVGFRARLLQLALVAAFALAAFVTGLFVFNYLLMPGLIHGKSEVRVPDLSQLSLDQAESVLAQQGMQLSRAGERFDPEVPRGFVISQDPLPGSPVRRQKTVQVVVSLGEEFSSVPALYGESRRSAEQLLKSAGLALGRISRAPSDDVGEGLVLATDPSAESVLPRDTPVGLLISAGAGGDSYLMPDLLGREIGRARAQLEAFGLYVRVPGVSAPVGAIVYQRPRPGAQITRRDTVVLQAMGRLIR